MVVGLEQGADLHMAQVMPLPLTVSRSSKIQIGFTFLVPAYPGCPGKEAVKWLLLLLFGYTCTRVKFYLKILSHCRNIARKPQGIKFFDSHCTSMTV